MYLNQSEFVWPMKENMILIVIRVEFNPCNLILGKWNDSIEILESAIRYLKNDPYKD